jgi:hypothetical protein
MNSRRINLFGQISRGTVVLAAALVSLAGGPSRAAEPNWPAGPYNYYVVDQDLRAVLQQFGSNLGIPLRMSDSVPPTRLKGKLNAAGAKEFLQWLCDSYGLLWYFDGGILHISTQSELANVYLDLGPVTLDELNQRLARAEIADARFALRPTAEPHLVAVMGPPVFLSLVRQTLSSMRAAKAAPPPQSPQLQPATAPPRQDAPPAPEEKPQPPKAVKQASPGIAAPTGKPTAFQNMGIELRFMTPGEKRRALEKPYGSASDGRGSEGAGVTVFRGGRR